MKKDVLEISRTPQMFGRDSATQSPPGQTHGQCFGELAKTSGLGSLGGTFGSVISGSSDTDGVASSASCFNSHAFAPSNIIVSSLRFSNNDNKKAGLTLGRDRLLSTVSLLHYLRVTAKRNRPRFSQKKKPVINMKHMEMVVEICCINVIQKYQFLKPLSTTSLASDGGQHITSLRVRGGLR
jgi:hypothetical protein